MLAFSVIFLTFAQNKYTCSTEYRLRNSLLSMNDEMMKNGRRWLKKRKDTGRTHMSSILLQPKIACWKCAEVLYVWVDEPALTIVRYINCVIIPLRLLGTHCSHEGAAPYKCSGLPRVPGNSKQMSQNTVLSISHDKRESLFNRWRR